MLTVQQAFDLALQHHQAGRLAEAEALYRQILAAQPNHAEARHFLGVVAHQLGRHDAASAWIQQSIALNPNEPVAHSNLGETYRAMGRLEEGVAAYRQALELQPNYAQASYNLSDALLSRGRYDEAIEVCQRAIEFHPQAPVAWLCMGNAWRDKGDLAAAIAAYQRALAIQPDYPEGLNNLGVVLRKAGRLDEAVMACRRALELKPSYAEACNNLGNALKDQGRLDEAMATYHRAVELKPDFAKAHSNLGVVLAELGRLDESIAEHRRALQHDPNQPAAHNNLGNALQAIGQLDEAALAIRRAIALQPDLVRAHSNLGNVLKDQGQTDEAIAAFRRALEWAPDFRAALDNLILTLYYQPGIPKGVIVEEQERWNRQFSAPVKTFIRPHANDRNPERSLRVGYVSADLRDHVVGRNVLPLFRHHDHHAFEVFCYAGVARPDQRTSEIREYADRWRSTVGVTDEALAAMIREDAVDILVDLAQHTAGNRLPIFARQPAPVQVSFAGYPESTGVEAISYRISDHWLEQSGVSNTQGATVKTSGHEQVFLLDSFWCYDPCGIDVPINSLPPKASGCVTFGCLNNFCKVNKIVLELWARVLAKVPKSRLILLSPIGSHRQRTLELLGRDGIDVRRIEFTEPCGRKAYLELYQLFDIMLDTSPYNGHTTSLDALWMGVPVVSLAGERSVSRAGLSQLSNLGLPELVAHSEDEYVQIAASLAHDLPRLAELRRTLRARMESSVLMDAPRFALNIEAVYRAMWRRWCAEAPR